MENVLTVHNLIILINSYVNTDESNYYYNIISEKGLNIGKSNTEYF